MKLLAYGPIACVAALLTFDAADVMPTMAPEMLQGGVLAVLAWTIYYVFVKILPSHERAQKDQRDAFLKFLNERLEDRGD